jgi:phenylalanyl-tRNA synthetase beta chain
VTNPIAADQTHLRTTLVPGIWRNIIDNARYFDDFRIFEIGVEIHKRPEQLPREVNHLCAAVFHREHSAEGLFELKRLAQVLIADIEARPAVARMYEHPARTADLILFEEPVGRLFEFHPRMVERGRGAVVDLDIDALMRLCRRDRKYRPIRRFPSSAFDLSVVAPARTLVGELQKQLASFAGDGLDSIEYVRQYSGPPLPEGTRSVSFRLTVSAPDRTLSSDDVAAIRQRIIDGMRDLRYDLRV